MPHRTALVSILAFLALWSSLFPQASPVFAHERREVGSYLLVVGWAEEPPLVGEKNAVTVRVTERGSERPLVALEQTLKVEVQAGDQRREFALDPVFRQPGQYEVRLIPTRPGDYLFRLFGAIEALQVDVLFDSREGGFDGVQSAQALQFPDAIPAASLISSAVRDAEQRTMEAQNLASSAQQEAIAAQALAVGALGIGVLGLLVGAVALVRVRQARQPVSATGNTARQLQNK